MEIGYAALHSFLEHSYVSSPFDMWKFDKKFSDLYEPFIVLKLTLGWLVVMRLPRRPKRRVS